MFLFWHWNPYDLEKTDKAFLQGMRKNIMLHYRQCEEYRRVLSAQGWEPERIMKLQSVKDFPFLPTLYFKHHEMRSIPMKKVFTTATSSGTSGNKSVVSFDFRSLWKGLGMVLSVGRVHKLWSLCPCHYIILGYEPKSVLGKEKEEKAVAKTAYGFTYFAPSLSRTYALKNVNGEYKLNLDEIKEKLIRFSKGKIPVRIMGFPFHAYVLLSRMKEEQIKCPLPENSMIAFGGGWKEHYTRKVDKETMYRLVEEVLGIPESRCREFFGAVEHPVLYCDCPKHHFHVPIYSRVIIRDVDTFEPVENGTPGLVNLVTPMVSSSPVLSIMTDDLGILHDGVRCGCGIETPYLEILGRVGMEDITTCAAGAEKLTRNILEEEIQ